MIICRDSCPLFKNCQDRAEWRRCILDYGLKEDKGDEFLERVTY